MAAKRSLRPAWELISSLLGRLFEHERAAPRRADGSIYEAEQAGLVFAFRARCLAVLVVAIAILSLLPWPRDVYYLAFAAGFLLSGYVPFRLRLHRHAERIKLIFVALDVALITGAVLNLPSGAGLSVDWPVQTRLRNQNFLYLLLLLAEAALTYSPRRVLWTGASIITVWSLGFYVLYERSDSLRFSDVAPLALPDEAILRSLLDPYYVSLAQWQTQFVATAILTVLLAIAVQRSRAHLLAQVQAEVVQSDLAKYVSPDVAHALTHQTASDFGAPNIRHVAVLFADIVGFTTINEHLSPEQTFALLRSFQETSSSVVFRHHGMLDKYLGDGFMATFGALETDNAAAHAIACAQDLLTEIERWNSKRAGRHTERLTLVIGLHYGPVIAGNLGSEKRLEFTVVGDVVNVASRLEGATRDLGCTLVVSDACVRAAGQAARFGFEGTAEVTLRGRVSPIVVHVAGRKKENLIATCQAG